MDMNAPDLGTLQFDSIETPKYGCHWIFATNLPLHSLQFTRNPTRSKSNGESNMLSHIKMVTDQLYDKSQKFVSYLRSSQLSP